MARVGVREPEGMKGLYRDDGAWVNRGSQKIWGDAGPQGSCLWDRDKASLDWNLKVTGGDLLASRTAVKQNKCLERLKREGISGAEPRRGKAAVRVSQSAPQLVDGRKRRSPEL